LASHGALSAACRRLLLATAFDRLSSLPPRGRLVMPPHFVLPVRSFDIPLALAWLAVLIFFLIPCCVRISTLFFPPRHHTVRKLLRTNFGRMTFLVGPVYAKRFFFGRTLRGNLPLLYSELLPAVRPFTTQSPSLSLVRDADLEIIKFCWCLGGSFFDWGWRFTPFLCLTLGDPPSFTLCSSSPDGR